MDTDDNAPKGTFARLMAQSPDAGTVPAETVNDRTKKRPDEETKKERNERWSEGTRKPRSNQEQSIITIELPSKKREKVRQSFDIFKDQKIALEKLRVAMTDIGHDRPKLGDMIKEALDLYIRKHAKELPNVEMKKRRNEETTE